MHGFVNQFFSFGAFFVNKLVHTVIILIAHSTGIVSIWVEILFGVVGVLIIRQSKLVCFLPSLVDFRMIGIQHI